MAEPLGMLPDVGMVRGALKGQIERDLEAVLPGPLDQPAEAGQGAELGMDLKVTTLLRPDRPGTAGVLRAGLQSVVLAFAIGSTDGVDGRQVEDVEAHARDVG